jgi:CheY-like chemotaxis protein
MINAVGEWSDDAGDVLLIAGDSDIAEMYRMKLELDGYRVVTVGDVSDSATRRGGWKPDLVLIDLDGGGVAGPVDLQRLRSDPCLGNVPALLLSIHSEAELRRRGFMLRPTDYVLSRP